MISGSDCDEAYELLYGSDCLTCSSPFLMEDSRLHFFIISRAYYIQDMYINSQEKEYKIWRKNINEILNNSVESEKGMEELYKAVKKYNKQVGKSRAIEVQEMPFFEELTLGNFANEVAREITHRQLFIEIAGSNASQAMRFAFGECERVRNSIADIRHSITIILEDQYAPKEESLGKIKEKEPLLSSATQNYLAQLNSISSQKDDELKKIYLYRYAQEFVALLDEILKDARQVLVRDITFQVGCIHGRSTQVKQFAIKIDKVIQKYIYVKKEISYLKNAELPVEKIIPFPLEGRDQDNPVSSGELANHYKRTISNTNGHLKKFFGRESKEKGSTRKLRESKKGVTEYDRWQISGQDLKEFDEYVREIMRQKPIKNEQ